MSFARRCKRLVTRHRHTQVVYQAEALECAHACLAMIARRHGMLLTLAQLREQFAPSTRGTSVHELLAMGHTLGLQARAYRAEPDHLGQLSLPCVVHWDTAHFVVLERCAPNRFELIDPGLGRMQVDSAEFDRRFTGIAIVFEPGPDFGLGSRKPAADPLALLRQGLKGAAVALASVISLALVLELAALTAPLFIQIVTDKIIKGADVSLLVSLTGAFLAVVVLQALLGLARTLMLVRLGETLTVGWNTAVCDRLLRLPYVFFVRRAIGDIHSRFSSIDAIQRTVTYRFVEGALDGVTALLSLAMILLYSPLLAGVTLTSSLVYGAFRMLTFARLRAAEEQGITVRAAQQSLLLEILHGIHSIKANRLEANTIARYGARTQDSARAVAATQWWTGLIDEAGLFIDRLHRVVAVAAGALLAIRGSITPGMLVAYLTYALQFTSRSSRLVDLVTEWRMLLLHADRLADIVAAPEPAPILDTAEPSGADLVIRRIRFRYNAGEPWVLDGVDCTVRQGECVAIQGPSGTGKSTLAKLIIGLLEPEDGQILLGGVALNGLQPALLRGQIACVLQDDQLFNGSIAENIAFFEPNYCRERVVAAARLAQMHAEVTALPLGYEARVIDMGASLSGGQRQRLILARALYRNPRILVLDEASSQLDLHNERCINDAIRALSITRILIAHRPDTLAIADRVLELRGGRLVEVRGREDRREPVGVSAARSATLLG